jgi:hypothetical protein
VDQPNQFSAIIRIDKTAALRPLEIPVKKKIETFQKLI